MKSEVVFHSVNNKNFYLVMVMNLYSAFPIYIFKCALQVINLWVRPDISTYRRCWQPLSVR